MVVPLVLAAVLMAAMGLDSSRTVLVVAKVVVLIFMMALAAKQSLFMQCLGLQGCLFCREYNAHPR
jgi:hypothetical protein